VQDAIDLFLGNYFVEDHDKTQPAPSPLALRQRDWKYITVIYLFPMLDGYFQNIVIFQFPLVLASAIAMFFANFLTPFGKIITYLVRKYAKSTIIHRAYHIYTLMPALLGLHDFHHRHLNSTLRSRICGRA